jgi:hypothetical protein
VEKPKLFIGSQNVYMDYAQRDNDRLSISIQLIDMGNPLVGAVSALMLRFVVWNAVGVHAIGPFQRMNKRADAAKFQVYHDDGVHDFMGLRLIKMAIPVLKPNASLVDFLARCDQFLVWELFADWLNARAAEEGFTPSYEQSELAGHIRKLVAGEYSATIGDDNYKLILELLSFEEIDALLEKMKLPGEKKEDDED